MSFLNTNIPPIECYVRGNYLRNQYRQKIKLYINQHYPIIVVEDFMLNDWTYVQKIKKNKMNKTYQEVSIHLDENKKE